MLDEPFYTRQQVRELLGIDNAGVARLVKNGMLPRIPVPDRKRALYPRFIVDNLARQYTEARRKSLEENHAQES